jgi:hypothetical protein
MVNGLGIWPLVRFSLSNRIRMQDFVGPMIDHRVERGRQSLLAGLIESFRSILRLTFSISTWQGYPIIFFTKPSSQPGEFTNFSGPLQQTMKSHGIRYLEIEVGNPEWPRSRRRERVLFLDMYWLLRMTEYLRNLQSLFKRTRVQLPGLRRASQLLSERFPSVDCNILHKSWLIFQARSLEAFRLFFSILLGIVRAKKIMVICYYSPLKMGYILGARKRHVLSADYQHGVQGRFHYAYGSFRNIPRSGYELLPDVFLNWSEMDKANIDQWAVSTPHRSIVVGNLLAQSKESKIAIDGRNYGNLFSSAEARPLILFTLQNFIPPDWIWDGIRQTSSDLKWLIRLHPHHQYLREVVCEKLAAWELPDVDVDLASAMPLPVLLKRISVHVTGNSSVVLDAFHSGKPSIVIDHYGLEYYDELIESGVVFPAFTPQQLKQALHNILSRPPEIGTVDPNSSFLEFLDSENPLKIQT